MTNLCKCGCGQPAKKYQKYAPGHYTKRGSSNPNYKTGEAIYKDMPDQEPPLCKCGCGQRTYWLPTGRRWAKYCKGHYTRIAKNNPKYRGGRKREKPPKGEQSPLCKCGCGELVSWDGGNGCWHNYVKGHYAWHKGMLSNGNYSDDWRVISKYIRRYYHNICQGCHRNFSKVRFQLHVHHKDGNKRNNIFDNLIPLCRDCHIKVHSGPSY